MLGIIVKRCLGAIPLLFLVSAFTFLLIKAVPGDPVDVMLGNSEKSLSAQQVQLIRHEMALDQPLYMQYWSWVSGWWGQGELGRSYRDGRPVIKVIAERVPSTLLLVSLSLVLAFAVGIASGLMMAFLSYTKWGSIVGRVLVAVTLFLYSAPSFWLAFFALTWLVHTYRNVPVLGLSPGEASMGVILAHLALPALLLSFRRGAKIALFVRALAVEEMTSDYVLVARAKGLSRQAVLIRHVFRNSLIPIINLLGLSLPALFGGSILIETVFGFPGMGRLLVDSTFGRNYPVLLGLVTVYGAVVILSNLMADVLSAMADPRSRDDGSDGGIENPAIHGASA
jgi:peptide/nickel transport system permease protein